MASILSFVLMNGLVFGGAALVARHGLRLRDWLANSMATALLGWVFIVVGLECLGAFGAIRFWPALGLAGVGFVLGAVAWIVRRPASNDDVSAGVATESSPHAGTLLAVAAWLAGTLAAWAALDRLIAGLAHPVEVVSDAPIYHLYFAIRWWKAGALELVPTPFGESAAPYFPANADVWLTWLLLPWSDETAAKAGQWPFLLVGALAVFALARELVGRWQVAVFPALLWVTGGPPLMHAGWADVDLVMAAWCLVGTWFLVRFARTATTADLVCAGLSIGAALGTKYVALLFAFCLVAAGLWLAWTRPRRWRHLAAFAACVALPCGFWFGRNWLLTGNPLYPLHVELFGAPIFQGWYTRQTMWTSDYHMPVAAIGALAQILLRAADPVLLPVWVAGIVAAHVEAIRGRRTAVILVGLAELHIFLYWCVNPYQTQERFLFGTFGLLAVPLALVLDRRPELSLPALVLIAWHLVVAQFDLGVSPFAQLGPLPASIALGRDDVSLARVLLLAAMAAALGLVWLRRSARWRSAAIAMQSIAVVVGVAASWLGHSHIERREPRLRFYPVWRGDLGYVAAWWKLEELSGAGRRIAYAGTNLPYYLFGMRLRNDVCYVNVNGHAGFVMHDYHAAFAARGERLATSATPDWDRRETDEAAWLRNLHAAGIELLFVGRTNAAGGKHNFYDAELFPIERTWADRNPAVFRLLYAEPTARVYAVKFP